MDTRMVSDSNCAKQPNKLREKCRGFAEALPVNATLKPTTAVSLPTFTNQPYMTIFPYTSIFYIACILQLT